MRVYKKHNLHYILTIKDWDITKEFILTEDFIKNYFYIESDKDYEILMKRKGFIKESNG